MHLLVQSSRLKIRGIGSEWSPWLHNYLTSLAYAGTKQVQKIAGALQPRDARGKLLKNDQLDRLRQRSSGDPEPMSPAEIAETIQWLFGRRQRVANPVSTSGLALRLGAEHSVDDSAALASGAGDGQGPDSASMPAVSSLAGPAGGSTSSVAIQRRVIAAQKRHTHWAGTCLARLKKLRLLGAGAFGRVFMVVDTVSGAAGALKLFQKKQTLRDEIRSEVTALAALPRHPGVMRLAVCLAMTDRMAIVTEFIDGTTLSNVVANGKRLRDDTMKIVLAQLVCAIGVCHQGGILHRDIKPGNIMVEASSGAVKLIDFGLSVEMKAQDGKRRRKRSNAGKVQEVRDAQGRVVLRKQSTMDRAKDQYGEDLPADLVLFQSHTR